MIRGLSKGFFAGKISEETKVIVTLWSSDANENTRLRLFSELSVSLYVATIKSSFLSQIWVKPVVESDSILSRINYVKSPFGICKVKIYVKGL